MEKMYKYTVAGHTFAVSLPEGYTQEEHLKPYLPFVCTDETEPLFTLRLALSDTLKELAPGKVLECLNDEAPYFWMFEKEGKYNFGFSYTRNHPDCILMPSDDYRDNVVYVPTAYAERLAEFALSNAMMLLYTFNTTPLDTLMVHASVVSYEGGAYMFLGNRWSNLPPEFNALSLFGCQQIYSKSNKINCQSFYFIIHLMYFKIWLKYYNINRKKG